MSLEIIEKESQILDEKLIDDEFDYSGLITSFSDFFRKIELFDIYTGEEPIPFKERDPEYKKILRTEFL
ncbi:MAG: hypothetical protein ACFE9R_11955 [Candidatus Hermodarchaeota archaeon]